MMSGVEWEQHLMGKSGIVSCVSTSDMTGRLTCSTKAWLGDVFRDPTDLKLTSLLGLYSIVTRLVSARLGFDAPALAGGAGFMGCSQISQK